MSLSRVLQPSSLLLLVSALSLVGSNLLAQEQTKTASASEMFMNGTIGFGIPYGGLGASFELGAGHFSSFAGLGYAPRRTIDTVVINATFNYLLGFRYYFDVNSDFIYPRIGLSFGWITNYYSERIGSESYKQKVEGLSLQVGTQFYSAEGFVLNLDLAMSSRHVILQEDMHPHFYTFYLRPAIGVGFDINSIGNRKKKSRTIKNERIDPLK